MPRLIESRDENLISSGEAERSPAEYLGKLYHAGSESRPLRLELPVRKDNPLPVAAAVAHTEEQSLLFSHPMLVRDSG